MTPPPPPPPTEQVCVLMPLQLETKFVPPAALGDDWTMLLRVIPQPPSVDRHTDHVTTEELRAMTLFRRSIRRSGKLTSSWFGTHAHREAFAVLARSVGPPRAVYLAQRTRAAVVDGRMTAVAPPSAPPEHPSAVRGLPPRLQVGIWTYVAGAEKPQLLGSLPQPEGGTIAPVLDLPDLADGESVFTHWVADWPEAVRVGLGGVFPIPDGLTPGDLGGVCVWGIGDEPAAPLWERHALSGTLGEVPLGSPTNSVEGAPSGQGLLPDEDGWWQTLLRRIGVEERTSLDDLVTTHLAGEPLASVARQPGRDAILAETAIDEGLLDEYAGAADPQPVRDARDLLPAETRLAPLLMHALWPVLWGSFAQDEWGLDRDQLGSLGRWAIENVNPQGPLPSVRIDDEPYGLIPITRLDAWAPSADDPDGLPTLVTALRILRSRLHERLVVNGTVRGADPTRYAALLGRGGASRSFGSRRSVRLDLLQTPPEWPAWDRRHASRAAQLALLQLTDPAIMPFLEVPIAADAVDMPLVQPRLSTSWGVEESFYRVPLPALLDTVLRGGASRTLHPDPGDPATSLGRLFTKSVTYRGETGDDTFRGWLSVVPDSLLARLLLQSCLTMNAWRAAGIDPPPMGPGFDGAGWMVAVQQVAGMVEPYTGPPDHRPAGDLRDWTAVRPGEGPLLPGSGHLPALPAPLIATGPRTRLELALGATLDTFSTRIDPWIAAIAWRRLRTIAKDSTPAARRLGAYGWTYGPFDGTPGPTTSGLLHTPSQGQTLVATLARDNFLESLRTGALNDRDQPQWAIALTGASTRIAYDLVADMRDGHHLYELVGREVERIVTTTAASPYRAAEHLRTSYPMHPERQPDPRQVCNGLEALHGILDGDVLPEPLAPASRIELEELRAAVDALGDLALLDGALASASRQPARAAAAMDGASGSAAASEPEYPRSPSSGRRLRTTVLSILPWRTPSDSDSGARRAEPSVAAFLEDQLGADWMWRIESEDGAHGQVTLSELGLRPVDTLALSSSQLRAFAAAAFGVRGGPADALVQASTRDGVRGRFAVTVTEDENRAWDIVVAGVSQGNLTLAGVGLAPEEVAELPLADLHRRVLPAFFAPEPVPPHSELVPIPPKSTRVWTVRDQLGSVLGLFDADSLALDVAERSLSTDDLGARIRIAAGAPAATVTDPPELARATRLCALLGTPATEQVVQADDDEVVAPAGYADLRSRYSSLYDDLRATIAVLRAAARARASEADRVTAIRRGTLWGVTPDMTPADAAAFAAAIAGVAPPAGATSLRTLARVMAHDLDMRRRGAPAPASVPTAARHQRPLDDHAALREAGRPDGVAALARTISSLAAPQANLPVLNGWDTATLSAATGLQALDAGTFEQSWLTTVATVRAPLARLEAFQLDAAARAAPGLSVWASSGDPWQSIEVDQMHQASRGVFGTAVPPFIAAIGPGGALGASTVAVGVVDSYTEVVPLRNRGTHAAFGFNAPLARAPQAILLAVPPNPGDPLTDDDIEVMLRELREVVVARTATMTDRADDSFLTRTTWLPADEPVSILDPLAHHIPS
jgi:hypothetical protein